MDIETVRTKMLAQVNQARSSALVGAYSWAFEVEDLTLYVTMSRRRKAEQVFMLRVEFDDFPRRAPSYVFVDRGSRQLTPTAWPPNVKHNDNVLPGMCTPGTREFHEKWHLNDAQHPWDADRYTVLDTLQRIHAMMERGSG
jgi:hypothetical protein